MNVDKDKKYFYYEVEFNDGINQWDIKDVASCSCIEVLEQDINEDFDANCNPILTIATEIEKFEFDVMVKYL